jgi:hypothetical protein
MEDSNANQATSPSPMTLRPSPTAGRSGGPRSAEGKRRSCQNARRHGIYTDERFLEGAAQFRALLIWKVAVLAAFKKIKNRGNELKDLLQRQGITEIAASKRTHFRAERAPVGAERSGISRIVTARRPPAKVVWRDRCRKLARRSADLQVSSSGDSRPTCPPEGHRYTNPGNKARMSMKTKDRLRNRRPLAPPHPRRGITGLPSSGEEGLGGGGNLWLGMKPGS